MKEKENRTILNMISNILFIVFMLIMTLLIIMTAQSKITGGEPSLFGNRLYIVDSGSMEPALPLNSLILVNEKNPDVIEVGDIITYNVSTGPRVTHRVTEVGENNEYFMTQGDANNIEDVLPVQGKNVIGVVTLVIPYIGYIFRFLSSTPGIVFIVAMAILAFIAPILLNKKPKEASKEA